MSKFYKYAIENGFHLGRFNLKDSVTFNANYSYSEYEKMRDMVYFLVCKKKKRVLKIGKTINFGRREKTYCQLNPDRTSIMIIRNALNEEITDVDVYCVLIPRTTKTIISSFSGEKYVCEISVLLEQERILVKEATDAGETLIFNKQKK